jgi:di/tricarboxylate transporter
MMGTELTLTPQMILVLGILSFTIYLFVSEVVRVDVAAIIVMILLGLSTFFKPVKVNDKLVPWLEHNFPEIAEALPWLNQTLAPLVSDLQLFSGFSGNAVMSIIAVMIIGAGLDRTGMMSRVAGLILRIGGRTEKRIIPVISGTVGIISSFMQNVGAAALFLPVVSRISSRTGLPMSRLLMPMGFCAILGGTVTLVGSSPLILLNDLILGVNGDLPASKAMKTFDLFDVTPIGLALVATGIIYFILAGRLVLPSDKKTDEALPDADTGNPLRYLEETCGVGGDMMQLRVTAESHLVGMYIDEISYMDNSISIIALSHGEEIMIAPNREESVWIGSQLVVIGQEAFIRDFAERTHCIARRTLDDNFASRLSPGLAGIAEIVIPPRSHVIGKRLRDLRLSKTYGMNVLALVRGDKTIREDRGQEKLQNGDTLIAHVSWNNLHDLSSNRDFIIVTDYPREETRPHKVPHAVAFFVLALSLVLFTDLRLSIALMTGAIGMVVTRVLSIDEAYAAVDWKTVFLLASLIPLGDAVSSSGTAAWIAQQTLGLLDGMPIWGIQAAIALLATFFTLVMSNVGATVLLVPLSVNIALGAGADPRIFALTVAIATSNSFLIPTHQVNALIMGPGGYRVADYMRAGGIMTLLFLVVAMVMLNVIF